MSSNAKFRMFIAALLCGATLWLAYGTAAAGENLLKDPSFEEPTQRDQFGHVFAKWGGWKYEGDCSFEVGLVAHSGKTSCLLKGGAGAKIRMSQNVDLEPGHYQITAYLRGLDIGVHPWGLSTEFMFNDKYIGMKTQGTFGWTKMTYVGEVKEKKKAGPSFGMWAPGYFWIDDVTLEKVGDDVPLTEKPVLDKEEAPIVPPGDLAAGEMRCPECGYRNMPAWKICYACGTPLETKKTAAVGPAIKTITSFEDNNPFAGDGLAVVEEHATEGKKALRISKSYAVMDGHQDWLGYDYLKADFYTDAQSPVNLDVEIQDDQTRDYWTRVNYSTVVPPGASTFILPIKNLYVGEKSRPGRNVVLDGIKKLVFSVGNPPAPVFMDNVRLERDDSLQQVAFDGLNAFSFGLASSAVMEGFTKITPGTAYSKGRGYGLVNAKIWRAFDVLQPEPLYENYICIESGGLAVDVPNGKYRVFVNMDGATGYWGEYPNYKTRKILAQGQEVVSETVDLKAFCNKYFHFWNTEDLPTENTFDKYQKFYFPGKTFDVDVTDGQLKIEFAGDVWACCVSAVIIYPVDKAAQGEKFMKWVEDKRRFYFDNYFKRILHASIGDPLQPTAEEAQRGFAVFSRDPMKDIYYSDTPFKDELGKPLAGEAFAGEHAPVTLAIRPLQDLGKVTVTPGDLNGPGVIPASAISAGYVSYRISRVTMEGSVYTISPRLIIPLDTVAMPKDITRQFWLTVKTPADAKPGLYKGKVTIKTEKGAPCTVPLEFTVRKGTLDNLDVPAGPWGYTIGLPFQDPAARQWEHDMAVKSLKKIREYGFTIFSGAPNIHYKGFKDGKPVLDFTAADEQMKLAKELGFLAVSTYGGGVSGINAYARDDGQMKAAGFNDYSEFIKAVYTPIQQHADENGWIPIYYNLGDEPMGDALTQSIANAEAYRKAFPKGPPFFSAASSYDGKDVKNPHFLLGKALHIPNWNLHSEDSVNLIHEAGGDWAFYNGGNRWTFGDYMYKAVKQFNLKFRITWHWNVCAGDPYYALDCREDDYAWCNSTPDGELVPAVEFERLREGLGDYRRLLTLARLAKEKAGTPEAQAGEKLIADRMASFKLGQREHDPLFGANDWKTFRAKVNDALEALRK